MGKPTGFMDYKRQDKTAEKPQSLSTFLSSKTMLITSS